MIPITTTARISSTVAGTVSDTNWFNGVVMLSAENQEAHVVLNPPDMKHEVLFVLWYIIVS